MDPIHELAEALYGEKVDAAARMPLAVKFAAGAELFEYACEVTRAGIRAQSPELDGEGVEREVRWRLELGRRMENRTPIAVPPPENAPREGAA